MSSRITWIRRCDKTLELHGNQIVLSRSGHESGDGSPMPSLGEHRVGIMDRGPSTAKEIDICVMLFYQTLLAHSDILVVALIE